MSTISRKIGEIYNPYVDEHFTEEMHQRFMAELSDPHFGLTHMDPSDIRLTGILPESSKVPLPRNTGGFPAIKSIA